MKTCSKCKVEKKHAAFGKDKTREDGLFPQCKDCRRSPKVKHKEELLAQGLKSCARCREVKPLGDFCNDLRRNRGKGSYCNGCRNELQRERYLRDNAEAIQQQERYLEHRQELLAQGLKYCFACEEVRSLDKFSRDRTGFDGWQHRCKDCYREYTEANAERIAEANRKYREENRERLAERQRWYYWEHREERREYYQRNRERDRENNRRWFRENPERAKSIAHKRRERKKQGWNGPADHKRIAEQMELLKDDPCLWCGTTEFPDGYHWDHIVPLAKGGLHVWWNIAKSCPADNLSKQDKIPPLVGLYDW